MNTQVFSLLFCFQTRKVLLCKLLVKNHNPLDSDQMATLARYSVIIIFFYVKEQLKMVKKIRELAVVKISQLHTSWRTDFVSESYDIHNDIF